jgi:hypothetical protein
MIIEESGVPPSAPVLSKPRRTPWLAAVLVIAVLFALAARWITGAHELSSYHGGDVTGGGRIGRAMYLDAAFVSVDGSIRTIDVRALTPVVQVNTAAASIGILLCHRTTSTALVGADDSTGSCTSVSAFHRGRITLDEHTTQVILVVTPSARGTVHIAGMQVTYRAGLRRGHQHVGIDTTVAVR